MTKYKKAFVVLYSMKEGYRNFLIKLAILIIDQATKSMAAAGKLALDTKLLSFNIVHNTGAGFGLLQGFNAILIWVSVIVIGLITFFYYSVEKKEQIGLILLAGGVFSNLIDRIVLGYVVDWIDLGWWPVFNVADSMIVVGVAWMIIAGIKK